MDSYTITTESEEAVAVNTRECLIQLRGSTSTRGRLTGFSISLQGVTAADAPVLVELEYQTTDGTASAATEVKKDPDAPNAQITGFHSFSAQPTAGDKILQKYIHPQGGYYEKEWPPGKGPMIDAATTSRIGIAVTIPAGGTAINMVADLEWDE